jgi:hypothetical protein
MSVAYVLADTSKEFTPHKFCGYAFHQLSACKLFLETCVIVSVGLLAEKVWMLANQMTDVSLGILRLLVGLTAGLL